jgi:hypothetical protein
MMFSNLKAKTVREGEILWCFIAMTIVFLYMFGFMGVIHVATSAIVTLLITFSYMWIVPMDLLFNEKDRIRRKAHTPFLMLTIGSNVISICIVMWYSIFLISQWFFN